LGAVLLVAPLLQAGEKELFQLRLICALDGIRHKQARPVMSKVFLITWILDDWQKQ
jgi:hypothetical protein